MQKDDEYNLLLLDSCITKLSKNVHIYKISLRYVDETGLTYLTLDACGLQYSDINCRN